MPHTIGSDHFTFSRSGGNTLVAEHSDLAAEQQLPRSALPHELYVRGKHATVLYRRMRGLDVYDAGREDLIASVYVPVAPTPVPNCPQLHILND